MKTCLYLALCSLALALPPVFAVDNGKEEMKTGDLLHILIGAYEGAASAADRSGHPFGDKYLSHEERANLKNNINRLQQELNGITNSDGSLNANRTAELLNSLQDARGGKRIIDFVHALNSLREIEQKQGSSDFDLGDIVGFLIRGGSFTSKSKDDNGSTLLDTLKLVYADRTLNTPDAAREDNARRLIAEALTNGRLSPDRHQEIGRLLEKLGADYRGDYQKWQATPPRPAVRPANHSELLDTLSHENLTPDQRERILQILRENQR